MTSGAPSRRRDDLRPLTHRQFKLFQTLIYRETGISLPPHKHTLLVRRLQGRLRELGLGSYHDYYELVTDPGTDEELVVMLDRITTNETRFFREPRQLEYLERVIVPGWREAARARKRSRQLRAWSTACSSGEEPFTLAMILAHGLPASEGWDVRILGTDISTRALDIARGAVWPIGKMTDIPVSYLKAFMLRGVESKSGSMKACRQLRSMVSFERLNLYRDEYPATAFDIILCRNVLIYFDPASKTQVVGRLVDRLAPGGFLLSGHAESLLGVHPQLASAANTVYRRVDERSTGSPLATATPGKPDPASRGALTASSRERIG